VIVECDDCGGQGVVGVQKDLSRGGAGLLGQAAGNDPYLLGEAVTSHGGAVAAAAFGRPWGASSIDVEDLPMPEADRCSPA
jgi:hypothetical protein